MTISFWFRKTPAEAKLSNLRLASRRSLSGFSLVEISIALGIFSFAILSIVGLLMVALDTSRETQRDSAMTSIIRTLDVDMRSSANAGTTVYYDNVGKPVASGPATPFYKVELTAGKASVLKTLFGLKSVSSLHVWSAKISYPPPSYPQSSVVLLGSSTY